MTHPGGLLAACRTPRVAWWLLGAAVLAALTILVLELNPYLSDVGDDAEFVTLGQGLANGHGFVWENTPDRVPHNRYPPGYPLLLAATMAITGTRADPLATVLPSKVVTALTFAASVPLLWPLARRRLGAMLAPGAVALYALNPFLIFFTTQVMSEGPYMLVELLALDWADRIVGSKFKVQSSKETSPGLRDADAGASAEVVRPAVLWRWVVLGVLLAAGTYVRVVGMATAAGALPWAWWRCRRGGAAATAAFLACMVPWWIRDATLSGGWRYFEEVSSAEYRAPNAGSASLTDVLPRMVHNGAFVAGKAAALGPLGVAGGVLVVMAVAAGLWYVLRHRGGAADWAAPPIVFSYLVWPIATGRHLLPAVPQLCIYGVAGLVLGAQWLARRRSATTDVAAWRSATALAATGVIAAAVLELTWGVRDAAANVRALGGSVDATSYYRDRPDWAHFLEAASWLRANGRADDVALSRRQFAFYVYSGRLTDKYRFDVTPDELDYATRPLAGRKYVIEDAFGELRGDFGPLLAALRGRGYELRLRYETTAPAVRVWELQRTGQ